MTRNNNPAIASGNREFDLHLHVLEHGCEGESPRYTIGVWEQTTQGAGLRAICHIGSFPDALQAIMGELEKAMRPEGIEITTKRAASTNHSCSLPCGSLSSEATKQSPALISPPVVLEGRETPSCRHCGFPTKSNGSCFVCENCGASTGCS